MKKFIFALTVFGFILSARTMAQQGSDLDLLDNKLVRHMGTNLPGWNHKRGTLIEGSKGVLVEFWSLPNRTVKISLVQNKSVEEARDRMRRFVLEETEVQEVRGLGDEAYLWGDGNSNIIFRKDKYTAYITTIADVERDADAAVLTREQKRERRRSEMKRLSKELAKHAADAMDQP